MFDFNSVARTPASTTFAALFGTVAMTLVALAASVGPAYV